MAGSLCANTLDETTEASFASPSDTLYSDWENTGIDLDQVVVTATRTPKLLSEAPIQTMLITGKDIQRLDVANVEDVLKQELPGVEFSYSMNMQVNMNMAGFAGQSVLFLVDGERLAGETNDNVDFERLVTSDIDHIEIVKGAVSVLYGSSANGGVINIITKDVSRLPSWRLNAYGRVGSHGEQRYGLDLGVRKRRFANTLSLVHNSTDCFRVYNKDNSPVPLLIDFVPGQSSLNVKDKAILHASDRLRLTGRLGYYSREMVRFAHEAEHSRYYDYSAGVKADYEASVTDHLELSYSFDQYDKTRYYAQSSMLLSGLNVREYSNVQNSLRALWNHTLPCGILTFGADYMHDYLANTKLADADYIQSSADAFAQFDWNLTSHFELVGALRYDYFQIGHNSQVTPKISAAWHKGRFNLRGGYGMGFRAPTLKELYYDFEAMSGWIITGNSDLKPEQSHNFNLSADYTHSCYNYTVIGYFNHIRNRITTGVPQSVDATAYLPYINLPEAEVMGFEATAQARWHNGLGAKLSYGYTYEHKPDQAPNQFMPARPHSFTYRIDYDRQFTRNYGLTVALNGRWLSQVNNREYRSPQQPSEGILCVRYPQYHLHKVQLIQRWRDIATLSLSVDNLLNYKPENYFYNAPLTTGRTYSVSLSLNLERQ
ncbi:MAG: TonB-dependent receptor [Bacteroidales bacterium]|nr:TonB-dependent receptor [Candidatus Liminaster caballi]